MCGITGIYSLDAESRVDLGHLRQMTRALTHRGPDDEGYYVKGRIGLGHRRLSIIDLAAGHQPMVSHNGSTAIVFNGEIYNFQELRSLLSSKGHHFRTRSDTEVILSAYEEYGEECVGHLRGMFAFAIWDAQEQRLFLARDRVGKKPLYYAISGRLCTFGSEIKALLQGPSIPRDIDYEALSDYLTFSYIPAPKTIFKAIRKLPPGHTLTITRDRIVTKQYWDLEFSPDPGDLTRSMTEQFLQLLSDSVRLRLVSDVPLGAFLSGGLDSSSVVALMSQALATPVRTMAIGFEEEGFSELPYAQMVAERFRTEHHEHILKADRVGIVDKLARIFDEPFGDSSAIPTYYVSQAARRHVTVALSGDGGDENLAGYPHYSIDLIANQLRPAIPAVLRGSLLTLLSRVDLGSRQLSPVRRAQTLLTKMCLSPERSYYYTASSFREGMKERLLRSEILGELKGYSSFSVLEQYFLRASACDPLTQLLYVDIKTYLTDDILTKVDRTSMANSLEVRAPFLDHELMEFLATVPAGAKLRGREGKAILRDALTGILPAPIFARRKQGFSLPLNMWLRGSWKAMGEQYLFDSSSRLPEYINANFVRQIWQEHQVGLTEWGTELWNLIVLEAWLRLYLRPGI